MKIFFYLVGAALAVPLWRPAAAIAAKKSVKKLNSPRDIRSYWPSVKNERAKTRYVTAAQELFAQRVVPELVLLEVEDSVNAQNSANGLVEEDSVQTVIEEQPAQTELAHMTVAQDARHSALAVIEEDDSAQMELAQGQGLAEPTELAHAQRLVEAEPAQNAERLVEMKKERSKNNAIAIEAGMKLLFNMLNSDDSSSELIASKFAFVNSSPFLAAHVKRMLAPGLDFGFRELMEDAVTAHIIEATFIKGHIHEQLYQVLEAIESTLAASLYLGLARSASREEFRIHKVAFAKYLPKFLENEIFEKKRPIYDGVKVFLRRAEAQFETARTDEYQGPILF